MPCLHREVSWRFHLLIYFGYEMGEAISSQIYPSHRDTKPTASCDEGVEGQ
jgi:hypothetical protein